MSKKFTKYDTLTGKQLLGDIQPEDIPFVANDKNYIHNQITPAAEWTINHTLDKFAAIAVVDSAGTVVQGVIKMMTTSQIILEFKYAFAGKAYLN